MKRATTGARTLRLWLCPLAELGADSPLEYEVLDTARRVIDRGERVLAELPALPRTELVLAAADVLLADTTLPKLSGSRLRAALPALAEPMLLGDIERDLVVAGTPDIEGRAAIAAIDRQLLRRTLDMLARLKIIPVSATPEPLALGTNANRWRVRVRAPRACARIAEGRGLTCSPGNGGEPPVELRLALLQTNAKPNAIEVQGECDCDAWSETLGVPVHKTAEAAFAPPVALELLQYEFSPRIADWHAWRLPAVLAVALALVWIIGLNVQAWSMLRDERQLRAGINATFREAFPQTQVILDPLAQMRRALADLRAGAGTGDAGDFISMATQTARALAPQADSVRVIEYRDRALQIQFDATAVDTSQKRDAIVEPLARAGLNARISETTLSVGKRSGS